jgi:hypothetical protein
MTTNSSLGLLEDHNFFGNLLGVVHLEVDVKLVLILVFNYLPITVVLSD